MNIDNLNKGLIIPNYKELCKILNEDVKTGKAKQLQLEEWERYFDYEKSGHKFKITEIYSKPKPKYSKAVYTKFIELLLMYELSTKESYTCNYTKTNLFCTLGMANLHYKKNNRYMVWNEISRIPNWQINHFYARTNQKLTEILFSALNSMKRRKLLSYNELRIISEKSEHRIANDTEEKQILRIERDVLMSMGCEKVPFMKIEEYYNRVNAQLHEVYGWDYAYKEYKLVFNSDQIRDDITTVREEFVNVVKKNKMGLNDRILNAVNKQAEFYYDKNCKEYDEALDKCVENGWIINKELRDGRRVKIDGFFEYPPDYVENQLELAEIFLSIGSGAD